MSRRRGSGSTAAFVILVTVALLLFFGVITLNTRDFNDFINMIRDWWK